MEEPFQARKLFTKVQDKKTPNILLEINGREGSAGIVKVIKEITQVMETHRRLLN